jgi:very-short-patch-repair endonuclease
MRLILNDSGCTDEEKIFLHNEYTHVDFLLYNSLTKRSLLAIEVDGWKYHNTAVQKRRDALKDSILEKYGLPLLQISTVQTITAQSIAESLRNSICV